MNSFTTQRFWDTYTDLPKKVQNQAQKAYRLFEQNPEHPSLRFKKVHPSREIFAARITRSYRALCVKQGSDCIWFWIGSHDEYERLISNL